MFVLKNEINHINSCFTSVNLPVLAKMLSICVCGNVASKYGQGKVILPLTKSRFSSETNRFVLKE